MQPLGFVATDYAIAIWAIADLGHAIATDRLSLADLFSEDMLGDDLEEWLNESQMMKRTFRQCAIISGMIERRFPGREKTGRQMTISTDLVFDVLRRHQPDHILLRAAYADASTGLLEIGGWAICWPVSAMPSCTSDCRGYRLWRCQSCWKSAGSPSMERQETAFWRKPRRRCWMR